MPTLPPAFLRLPRRRLEETWPRDEKGGTEEARVTEEFRNDRRPVASLTDDALLRSRLQAQKDGTTVMDSKWLEIVGRCHRTSLLFLCFFFGYLYPLPSSRSKLAARECTPSKTDRRAWNFARFSFIFFCALELPLTPARNMFQK